MSGWFAMNRAIFTHPIFEGRPDRIAAWAWIIATAAWQDTRQDASGKTVTVNRGQLLTSYRQMSKATGVSVKSLRNLIERLQGEDAIGTDTGTGRLLITVRNYDKYQAADGSRGTARAQQGHSKGTQKKQGNKGTKIREAKASLLATDLTSEFDQFWECVPRKVGKDGARAAFSKARQKASLDELLDGMRRYAREREGQDAQYTAHPASWLNKGRWQDEDAPSQADFHNAIQKRLEETTNGLPGPREDYHGQAERLSAPIPEAPASGQRERAVGNPGHGRRDQQSHLSLINPRRFGSAD